MVNDFVTYYHTSFRVDFSTFLSSIPIDSKNHNTDDPKLITIQYERLTRDFPHLDFLKEDLRKAYFGVTLFFTVLIDEVFYTFYKAEYGEFRKLTFYPKFIGNCPSSCRYHFHPKEIFLAMNYSRNKTYLPNPTQINFNKALSEAIPVMQLEIYDFLYKHFPLVNSREFWKRCQHEFNYT